MTIQGWVEWLRGRQIDEYKAVAAVSRASRHAYADALAPYDAFVDPSRAVREGLLLGTAVSSAEEHIPIRLPFDSEWVHWLVQGGTGTGKTTWVASVLEQEMVAHRAFGIVDCKGDLFGAATGWTAALLDRLAPARRAKLLEELVIVNPFSDDLVPLNVCRPLPGCTAEVQAYEVTIALSRLFDAALGLHMENILRHLLLLLMDAGLTLVEAPEVLQDDVLRGVLATKATNPAVRDFFLTTYGIIPQVSKDAVLARLQSLLLPENFRLMLGADDLLDLRGIFDHGRPLFVFLGKGPGVPEEQVEIVGSLFLQLLFQAAYARGTGQRSSYLLALDEFYHLLAAPALARRFETALTTVRSFGISLMLIHHSFAQVPPALREIALTTCDCIALFRTSGHGAEAFGEFLPETSPELHRQAWAQGKRDLSREESRRYQLEALQRLPDRHCYWYDRRRPYRAVKLRVPDRPPLDAASRPALTGSGISRAVLRKQIDARKERLGELVRPPIVVRAPRIEEQPASTAPPKKRRPRLG